MSLFKRYKTAIICVLALIVPFFFLKANLRDPSRLGSLDKVILTLSTPIQWAATATAQTIYSIWSDYIFLVNTEEENMQLKFETSRLRAENHTLQEAMDEVTRLRKMLGFRETMENDMVAANVISRGISEQFRVIGLKVSAGENVAKHGMPVANFNGLVGQISRSVGDYSEVMLTVDRMSMIPVYVQRNGAQGILRGTGELDSYTCDVEYLLRSDEVRQGDRLFTSGAGGKFPEGILTGRIIRVERENLGLFQKVVVKPSVDFSRINEVFIISHYEDENEQM